MMTSWYCLINGQERGDFSEEELKSRILSGEVTRDTPVKPSSAKDGGWKKAGDTELVKLFVSGDSGMPQAVPAPKAGEETARAPAPLQNNYFAWGMVGVAIPALLLPGLNPDSIGYYVMVFGMGFLNLLLAHFDAKMIEKAGYGRMKWGAAFCAFLLPPAYLYMRASKSKQKPLQLYAWLAAVLCLGIGLGIGMAMLESRGGAGLKGKRARQEAGAPVILPGLPEKGNFADSDVRKPKEEPKEEPREEPKAERNAPSGGEEVNEDIFSGMRVARIKGDNVNVRREPSTQSKVMFIVHKEEDLLIIDKTPVKDSSGQNWYSVRYRWIEPEFDEVNFSAYIIEQFIEIGPITEELKAWLGNI